MKAVAIRARITAASASTYEKCVTLLIWIRSPNLATTLPAWTEIMVAQNADSLTNRDHADKFKILRRWEHVVTGNLTTPATGNEMWIFEEYIPLKSLESLWAVASTTGVIADMAKGALILGTLGLNNYGATTTPLFVGNARVYFSDP